MPTPPFWPYGPNGPRQATTRARQVPTATSLSGLRAAANTTPLMRKASSVREVGAGLTMTAGGPRMRPAGLDVTLSKGRGTKRIAPGSQEAEDLAGNPVNRVSNMFVNMAATRFRPDLLTNPNPQPKPTAKILTRSRPAPTKRLGPR